VTPELVERTLAEVLSALRPHTARDWAVRAGGLDWSCRDTAAHVAHDLLAYAGQLAARPTEAYLPMDLTVAPEAPPSAVLDVVQAAGTLLRNAVAAAAPADRAWHWGPTDATGFAALGMDELLMHGWDIAQGLGLPWRPPAELSAVVLRRLFPDPPPGDPTDALLWCTGRVALPGHPRRTSWVLKAALADQP
jgi:uncharacterized protein (TIGR03083 family)